MHTIEISDEAYEAAKRTAALDSIDVTTLVESLVRRHAEYIELFQEASPAMPRFSLEHYEMGRIPGESEEDYQDRPGDVHLPMNGPFEAGDFVWTNFPFQRHQCHKPNPPGSSTWIWC